MKPARTIAGGEIKRKTAIQHNQKSFTDDSVEVFISLL